MIYFSDFHFDHFSLFSRTRQWDPVGGLESFTVERISKAQAWQRAGRAGRESAGVCLRLYTDAQYKSMSMYPQPELLRVDLASVLLNLAAIGIENLHSFPWLSQPCSSCISFSLDLLSRLGALRQLSSDVTTISLIPENASSHSGPQVSAAPLRCGHSIDFTVIPTPVKVVISSNVIYVKEGKENHLAYFPLKYV
ncbi:unnamed protein product [Protopolystoma xenopodis]|uniref:Helicase C-terminal domain-containing protein n=1 Tax=Protopolystoma xenopodis TaxID=117903 RepID=A0A448WAZ2_9PLAT|nr:unnamed protein product [Protopolystoma xenopodis]